MRSFVLNGNGRSAFAVAPVTVYEPVFVCAARRLDGASRAGAGGKRLPLPGAELPGVPICAERSNARRSDARLRMQNHASVSLGRSAKGTAVSLHPLPLHDVGRLFGFNVISCTNNTIPYRFIKWTSQGQTAAQTRCVMDRYLTTIPNAPSKTTEAIYASGRYKHPTSSRS
jgi:hypothetical protein